MKILFFGLILLTTITYVKADGNHDAPATTEGAAKLLENGEFTLSPKSEKRLGLKWEVLDDKKPWMVPKEAIVKIKFTTGVYRKFEGRITMVILESFKESGDQVIIHSPDLEPGDEVAVKGVKYIRLAEVDISSGTVDNCSH